MIEVLKFILKCTTDFLKMLFTIDVGNGLSLGLVMCVIFIFLPLMLLFVDFLKTTLFNEIDEKYDLKQVFGIKEKEYVPKHTYEYKAKHRKR